MVGHVPTSVFVLVALVVVAITCCWCCAQPGPEREAYLSPDEMSCADLLNARYPSLTRSDHANEVIGDLSRGYTSTTANGSSFVGSSDAGVCVMPESVERGRYRDRDATTVHRCAFGPFRLPVADGEAIHPRGCVFDPASDSFLDQLDAAFAIKSAPAKQAAQLAQDAHVELQARLAASDVQLLDATSALSGLGATLAKLPLPVDTDFESATIRHASLGVKGSVIQKAFTTAAGTAPLYFTMAYKYCSEARKDPYELWMRDSDTNVTELDSYDAVAFISAPGQQYRNDALMRRTFNPGYGPCRVIIEVYQNQDNTILSTTTFDKNVTDDLESWFSASNVRSSSITALSRPSGFNVFSLAGDAGRRFFISVSYRGCDLDHGAFVIPTRTDVCWWDAAYQYSVVSAKDDFIGFAQGIAGVHPGRPYADMVKNQVGNRMIVWVAQVRDDPYQKLGRHSVRGRPGPAGAQGPSPSPAYSTNYALPVFALRIPNRPAIDLGAFGIGPWGPAGRFVDGQARWIWSTPNAQSDAPSGVDVTFQKLYSNTSAQRVNATLHIIVDNRATVYVNRVVVQSVSGGWDTQRYPRVNVVLNPGLNLVEVVATNDGGPAGLVFALVNDLNGATLMRSDVTTVFSA